jgi:hypothetical protein
LVQPLRINTQNRVSISAKASFDRTSNTSLISGCCNDRLNSRIPRRRGGPGHDYDIEVGLRLVALEVTKSAPQERNALNAAIRRLHEREITCTTTHWQLTIPDAREGYPGPPLHPIFDEAPPHLRLLEEHGVWGFGPGHEWQCLEAPEAVQACIAELFALGLISGNSVGPLMPKDRPLLLVGTRGEGSMPPPTRCRSRRALSVVDRAGEGRR